MFSYSPVTVSFVCNLSLVSRFHIDLCQVFYVQSFSYYFFLSSFIAAPEFSEAPTDQIVTEGGDAIFSCPVVGIPTPEITWFKNGETIDRKCFCKKKPSKYHKISAFNVITFLFIVHWFMSLFFSLCSWAWGDLRGQEDTQRRQCQQRHGPQCVPMWGAQSAWRRVCW